MLYLWNGWKTFRTGYSELPDMWPGVRKWTFALKRIYWEFVIYFEQEIVTEKTGRSEDVPGNSEWNDDYYMWSSVRRSGRNRPGVRNPIYQEIVTDLFWY
jgi:hypothetical protein